MGFNNSGAPAMARRLARQPWIPLPIGISLGKSKITPIEESAADYCASLRLLYPFAGYFAVNVSSPNTPGLRALQDRAQLATLLERLQIENAVQAAHLHMRPRPLLVKIAPDLSEQAILDVLQVCADHQVAGIIAANTTLERTGLAGAPADLVAQAGGLSGHPLSSRSRQIVAFISRETGGRLPIIGVGGIFTADDALRMLDAGASLLQVYTGLVYEGPGLVGRIKRATRGY
jgi:dihydroorotate dehydrogenase